jgi:hypothetical protein
MTISNEAYLLIRSKLPFVILRPKPEHAFAQLRINALSSDLGVIHPAFYRALRHTHVYPG